MLNFGYVFAFQYCCTGNFQVSDRNGHLACVTCRALHPTRGRKSGGVAWPSGRWGKPTNMRTCIGSFEAPCLRRVLRRRLVRVSVRTGVLRRVLRRGGVIEGTRCLEGRNTPFRRARPPSRAPYSLMWCITTSTVRAGIITELSLERAGPVIFKTFLLELIAFRPIPVNCPARGVKPENYWKR